MTTWVSRLWLIALLLGLGACIDTPQPFRHEGVGDALTRPTLIRVVAVRPVEGVANGRALADAVVKSLDEQSVPAIVSDQSLGGSLLVGRLERGTGPGLIVWTMLSPEGEPQASYRQTLTGDGSTDASPKAYAELGNQVSAALSARDRAMGGGPGVAAKASRRPTVRLGGMEKLPGDGTTALKRALRSALERRGIMVLAEGGDFLVEGHVGVSAGPRGQDVLKVSWVVSDAKGGKLGNIDQQGEVPKGRLDQPWGDLARDIAEGGAAGSPRWSRRSDRRPNPSP